MLVDGDAASGQCGTPGLRFDLKRAIGPTHSVVLMDRAFMLNREDTIQILACRLQKRAAGFSCSDGELFIEVPDVGFGQKRIRVLEIADAGQPQFLRQTALPGLKTAFASTARLWRIGGNHLNSKVLHRPSDLR